MDSETINADRTLGLIELQASDYISQAENGEFLVHDTKDSHAGALRMHGKGNPKGILNYTAAFYPCLNIADPEDVEKKPLEQAHDSIDAEPKGRLNILFYLAHYQSRQKHMKSLD
jgi:Ca2+-dependent lipid-binding protein